MLLKFNACCKILHCKAKTTFKRRTNVFSLSYLLCRKVPFWVVK